MTKPIKKVSAGITLKGGQVLIAKRLKTDSFGGLWEFPGGKIEEGETPEKCLIREFDEEFGMKIKVGPFFCASIDDITPNSTVEIHSYFVKPTSKLRKMTAHEEWRWISIEDLPKFKFPPADTAILNKLMTSEISEDF